MACKSIAVVAFVLMVGWTSARGAVLTVALDGTGEYTEIQPAIDTAVDGETVLVKPGEYVLTESITFKGKAIAVRSELGAGATTLRMAKESSGSPLVLIDRGESPSTVLQGFTLTGATVLGTDHEAQFDGGGIRILNRAAPSIQDCIITGNEAFRGGGIGVDTECAATLVRCTISDNSAIYGPGGGIVFRGSSLAMTDCVVSGNSSTIGCLQSSYCSGGLGGGLYLGGLTVLERCTISRNYSSTAGGGILLGPDVPLTATSCRIMGNSSQRGGGLEGCCSRTDIRLTDCFLCFNSGIAGAAASGTPILDHCTVVGNGGGGALLGTPLLSSCIIWGNGGPAIFGWGSDVPQATNSCIEGPEVWPGEGNIRTDPGFGAWGDRAEVFVGGTGGDDGDGSQAHPYPDMPSALTFDLRLSRGSPCRGTGEGGSDMGAASGTCETPGAPARTVRVSPGSYLLRDVNLSCNVSVRGGGEEQTELVGTVHGLRTGSVLEHVTVTGALDLGGIQVGRGEAPHLRRVTSRANMTMYDGGGVYCGVDSAPVLTSCTITGNWALDGGGLCCGEGSHPTLDRCVVSGNLGYWAAGGIYVGRAASPSVRSCLIIANSIDSAASHDGIAITCQRDSTVLLSNCTIAGHKLSESPVVYCKQGSTVVARNCIVWGNGDVPSFASSDAESFPEVEFCCVDGSRAVPPGPGNFRSDPSFFHVGHYDFKRSLLVVPGGRLERSSYLPDFLVDAGDYHLQPGSPAVDAGVEEGVGDTDLDGNPRRCGNAVDVGAYESCPASTPPFRRGDANGDGRADISDAVWILTELFRDGPAAPCDDAADTNDDGLRDISDGAFMIQYCFRGGTPPPTPFAACGGDPTDDEFGCSAYEPCE